MEEYKTILNDDFESFIEKKSKFIGYARPVKTNEEAVEFINEIKSKHWDATHNVYAYVLREGQIKRYSDDGEPQGTAGVPVLDVLLKEELTDLCVVVTRYFGGILLGTGGLVRAYSHAAKIGVEKCNIVKMSMCDVAYVKCDYNYYGKINSLIPEFSGKVEDVVFADNVKVIFTVPENKTQILADRIVDSSNGLHKMELIEKKFAIVK